MQPVTHDMMQMHQQALESDFSRQHYLLDLMSEHAALDAQDGGDIDVLLADGVEPGGETVQQGQEKHPGELQHVKHSLQDVIWSGEIQWRPKVNTPPLSQSAKCWLF